MKKLLFSLSLVLFAFSIADATPLYFWGDANGGVASGFMDIGMAGNTLTVTLKNTSPILQDDGTSPNAPAITGFGFNMDPVNLDVTDWTLSALTTQGVRTVIGSNTYTTYWSLGTFQAGVTLDYLPHLVKGIGGALYNPLAVGSPALAAEPDYFTDAILTMHFASSTTLSDISSEYLRMQNVGDDGSLKLTPVPEPGTLVLMGAGFFCLAIYAKRRKNS